MRFDMVDLRLFVNTHKAGSITAGANLSNLSLQSASERIRGMENELGVLLLTRSSSGIKLTNAGLTLLNHANQVLLQIDHMRSELRQYSQGLRGYIDLLCNSSAQAGFLPKKLADYLQKYANISVGIREMPSEKIISSLNNQMANLGIVANPSSLYDLEFKFLCDDHLVIFAPLSKSNDLNDQSIFSLSQIDHHDFIGLSQGNALQDYIDHHAQNLGTTLNYRMRLATMDAVMQLVSEGLGYAILPRQVISRFIGIYPGNIIPLSDEWAKRKLYICVRRLDELPSYMDEFVKFLLE
ncbi:LysR substrate-binding domain-containing protein [Providencia zhijiangensis]|uniref:LysR substrate-binding domain-containing protein n=1 Tax=Providencia zhijiangensis TaxID=3053982 RepID=A0ABZ0N638_9GAMM|nr:LysR substrate-binding domain-containing protein [Providencia sp. D4759]WPA93783.1 LysR substrate-binding domain-containing protein [Providencia sp. D4759]